MACYLKVIVESALYSVQESENIGWLSHPIKQVYDDHCANEVMGYSDADWARPGHKSTSGYVFMINGGAASWMSQTQPVVALSAARTECIAASEAVKGSTILSQAHG